MRKLYSILLSSLFILFFIHETNRLGAQSVLTRPVNGAGVPVQIHSEEKCASHFLHNKVMGLDANARLRMQSINESIRVRAAFAGQREIHTVPVVVHFIEPDVYTSFDTQRAQIAVDHLNDAFANSNEYYDFFGQNVEIRFCLAAQDPEGNETEGFTSHTSVYSNVDADNNDLYLKDIVRWDPFHYVNIWVVNDIWSASLGSGVAGYAYFPQAHGSNVDGIVVEYNFFGNTVDNDKVLIHELGHYFGLYHTFEGGCQNNDCTTDGDRVCDTPPDNSNYPSDCFSLPNTCSSDTDDASINNPFRSDALGGLGDQPDMIQNYMDYGYANCQHLFTNGQSTRMSDALLTARSSLLESLGCVELCPWVEDITLASPDTVLVNQSFTASSFAPDAASYTWFLNGDSISDLSQVSLSFSTVGVHVLLIKTRYAGTTCFRTAQIRIVVECNATASFEANENTLYTLTSTVMATNTSSNAISYDWILNGEVHSNSENWQETFNEPGQHFLYLISHSASCSDTSSTYFFKVGDCNYSRATSNWAAMNTFVSFENNTPSTNLSHSFFGGEWLECTSAISNDDGEFLFATNGEQIIDANFSVMPNGDDIMGHFSSNGGCIIVPSPAHPNQYYVFTSDAIENGLVNGVRYSIVDMTLNNGLGDVIAESKNTLLRMGLSERLSATWHKNERDIWLVTHAASGAEHFSFLINGFGVNHNPVVSYGGHESGVGLGAMTFSHDGHRLATFNPGGWPWTLDIASFNRETGLVYDFQSIELSTVENEQFFSFEFSPDNSKLYATSMQGGRIKQFDLSQTTTRSIQESKTVVMNDISILSQMKTGIDGIIYFNNLSNRTLSKIENPNAPGALCNITLNHPELPISAQSSVALMNSVEGYDTPKHPRISGPDHICADGETQDYGTLFTHQNDQLFWSHAGPSNFIDHGATVSLTNGNAAATDTLYLHVIGGCDIYDDTLIIHSNTPVHSETHEEVSLCDNQVTLYAFEDAVSQTWFDGAPQNAYLVTTTGEYSVSQLENTGCRVNSYFTVIDHELRPFTFGEDIHICAGESITLTPSETYEYYQWSTGETTSSIEVDTYSSYWLFAYDSCGGMYTDTVVVFVETPSLFLTYNGQEEICDQLLPVTLTVPFGFFNPIWNNNTNSNSFVVTEAGTVLLSAQDAYGCEATDTFFIDNCSLVEPSETNQTITVFPNPANSHFIVQSTVHPISRIRLIDTKGAIVLNEPVYSSKQYRVNLESVASGIYWLECEMNLSTERRIVCVVR